VPVPSPDTTSSSASGGGRSSPCHTLRRARDMPITAYREHALMRDAVIGCTRECDKGIRRQGEDAMMRGAEESIMRGSDKGKSR
jgi:hypothetical protein